MHQVYLGLGSNQGDREALMRSAIRLIGERVGSVVRQSSMIETEPWGFESVNKFLNAAILCQTEKSPREVLTITQQIERELGRRKKTPAAQRPTTNDQRSTFNVQCSTFNVHRSTFNVQRSTYTDRPIDIDILLYDDLCIDEPDLKIPHPLMQERDFVMIPLHEISD